MLVELLLLSPSLPLSLVLSQGPCMEGVTMYSLLVTVLLLATAANNSRGQGAKRTWGGESINLIMCSCVVSTGSGLSCTCVVL